MSTAIYSDEWRAAYRQAEEANRDPWYVAPESDGQLIRGWDAPTARSTGFRLGTLVSRVRQDEQAIIVPGARVSFRVEIDRDAYSWVRMHRFHGVAVGDEDGQVVVGSHTTIGSAPGCETSRCSETVYDLSNGTPEEPNAGLVSSTPRSLYDVQNGLDHNARLFDPRHAGQNDPLRNVEALGATSDFVEILGHGFQDERLQAGLAEIAMRWPDLPNLSAVSTQ